MNGTKIKLNYNDLKHFVSVTSSFESDIDMIKDSYVVDAKSIMGIFSLDFSNDVYVKIHSNNENEIIRFLETMKEFE